MSFIEECPFYVLAALGALGVLVAEQPNIDQPRLKPPQPKDVTPHDMGKEISG
jgi:hypothetical protein